MTNDKLTEKSHAEALEWAMKTLKQSALNTSVVVETHWSIVVKIGISNGSVYLKQTPPDLFIEARVLRKCREICGITDVPEVIAVNNKLHCFLMKECGDATLRILFDGKLNVELLIQGLEVYKNLQHATAKHVDVFLQDGVPDWRLKIFSKLYQDLVSDDAFLKAHQLKSDQIKILQNAVRKVETLCQELSQYGISESLNNTDFHDNNMLFSHATQKIRIIDMGETAISHPLFSLAAFLKIPSSLYNGTFSSVDYQKLRETCFNGWLEDKKSMVRVIEIINILLPVYLLFAQKRFLDAIDLPYNAENPMSVKQHGKIYKGFIWFLENV